MKKFSFDDREAWLVARRGKITGSRLKDIVSKRGTGKKIGYYELIAERLATAPTDENPMDRGQRLESEALDRFEDATGKQVDRSLVIWARDDNESIAISPDAFMGDDEAVEVKCLASARHVEAYITRQVPAEYEYQVLQYFIVNDALKTLHMVFYDPRMPSIEYFVIEVTREEKQEEIDAILQYERDVLAEVDEFVLNLTF